ncbi:MAG: tetratricopeptide repeat protein [Gammaproteobacteria bacterium]|nr:tetratricopeptide repeat protein [Gammaproteobacteria bacterium]
MPSKRQQRTEKLNNDSILDQIERVVRWGDEFRLAFIKCDHPAQQEILRHALLERLSHQRILEISLDKPIVNLLDEIKPLWDPDQPPVAVCVYGLEYSLREQGENSPVLGRLNHDRDLLRKAIPAALLIWLSDFTLDFVARGAPDFWAWRSGVYEFKTENALWELESIAVFDNYATSLDLLSWKDKQQEITRLEELLRTSNSLIRQDKFAQIIKIGFLNRLGLLYISLDKPDEALGCYQQALKLADAFGYTVGKGITLNNLSQIYRARGDYDVALRYLEESLAIHRAIGDRAGEGRTLNNLSQIYQARGDDGTALRYLEESLAIHQAIDDRAGEGTTLNDLSVLYYVRGDDDTALRYLEEALAIQQTIGDRAGESTILNNLSQIYQGRGDYDTALRYLEEALVIRQTIGDRAGEGTTLNNLSLIYSARGDYDTALRYLEEALAIQQTIGDRARLCQTLFNMGYIYLQKNEHRQVVACWVEAYQTAKEIGLSDALMHLKNLAKQLGGSGLEYWERLSQQMESGE